MQEAQSKVTKKSKSWWKVTIGVLMLLFLLLVGLLQLPAVQTILARKVSLYLSNEIDAQIEIEKATVNFFLDIVFTNLTLFDREGNQMIHADRTRIDIQKVQLFRRHLFIQNITLTGAGIDLKRYYGQEELNIAFLAELFADRDPDERQHPWKISCRGVRLSDSYFSFTDQNVVHENGTSFLSNLHLTNIQLLANNISLRNDSLALDIRRFGFVHSNGFVLDNLSASFMLSQQGSQIKNLNLTTPLSQIRLNAALEYDSLTSFRNFASEVELNIELGAAMLNLTELDAFVPALRGMSDVINIKGDLNGTVSNLRTDNIEVFFGRNTFASGRFHLIGLPEIENTFFNLNIRRFETSVADINSLQLPYSIAKQNIRLPHTLTNLGAISFNGWVTGFINDMVAFGSLNTSIGRISSDMRILRDPATGMPGYRGTIVTSGFDVGRFIGAEDQLGLFTLNAVVEGRGITRQTVDLNIDGNIGSAEVLGYNYENITIQGDITNQKFNGKFVVSDPNVFLDFNGIINFEQEQPLFDFYATIENANLTRLNIFQRDSLFESVVSGKINIGIKSWQPYNIDGQVEVLGFTYEMRPEESGDTLSFTTGPITLSGFVNPDSEQVFRLYSDFVDASLQGKFRINDFVPAISGFVESYIPAWFADNPPGAINGRGLQGAKFNARVKDTRMLTQLFLPQVSISENSSIHGSFGADKGDLQFQYLAEKLTVAGNTFSNLVVSGSRQNNKYLLTVTSEYLQALGRFSLEDFTSRGIVANDSLTYHFDWQTQDSPRQDFGKLSGQIVFIDGNKSEMRLFPSVLVINDSEWFINPGSRILFDSARTEIRNFLVTYGDAYALADGVLSRSVDEYLLVEFNQFDTQDFTDLLNLRDLDFGGSLSGFLTLGALAVSPRIEADLIVNEFSFNFTNLGNLHVRSIWDNTIDAFSLDLEVMSNAGGWQNSPLRARGYFYPQRQENNFDLAIQANRLPMQLWARYLDSFASNFRGLSSGNLHLYGSLQNPELSGRLFLEDAGMRINFLNTDYTMGDSLVIEKNQFVLNNMQIADSLGNTGNVHGRIMHNNFKDFALDLYVAPDRMAVLNTRQGYNNIMFYGKAFASGLLHIYGPANNLSMNIRARTNRGTQIFLPLDRAKDVGETHFITFVNHTTEPVIATPVLRTGGNLRIAIELEVTPDAEVNLVIDSRTGDQIRGRGAGVLTMEAPPDGNFTMMGDFTIGEGEYLFNLQNIINKRFRIEEGGTIRWSGDPLAAVVDLRAVYRTRTPLYDLFMNLDTSVVYRRRVPVETNLLLRGSLSNPAISFDITLPGADEATRELLSRVITTDQEMNRQVFSLLVLNRFLPTSIDQYNTALGFGVGSTSSEMLSNQLSNWLSQISNDFDIGINYRPGNLISSQELEVALSTQLFNDRVSIDGNLGMAGQNPALANRRTSSIVGDINVEVKITPEGRFRVKAFNRSNAFEFLENQAPYTQGVGVFYRREFDSFMELLRRYRQPTVEIIETNSAP